MKILITGGKGYIAKSMYEAFKDAHDITVITRDDFDHTCFMSMTKFFEGRYFDVVIHTAAAGVSEKFVSSVDMDMDTNLIMYYNLLQHKDHYKKLIYFGSGAEHYKRGGYADSKKVIKKSMELHDNFYNIQVYGVFDENELDTRFIKSNILRYIRKEPMKVNYDKKMTFFYMKDLIKMVDHIINTKRAVEIKNTYAAYIEDYYLIEICDFINGLGEYIVPITIGNELQPDYTCPFRSDYNLDLIGLKEGIKETYNKLK
jgi:nucleoside-diphosphate-sugar epimerase